MPADHARIERLLDRASESLEAVLPHVENHYARLQLRALGEMLRNVATRVEQRSEQREATVERTRSALVALADLSRQPLDPQLAQATADLRAELARRIDTLYLAGSEEWRTAALAALWTLVRADFDAERALIRTGMYSS